MISQEIRVRGLLEECLEFKRAAAQERGVALEAEVDDREAVVFGDRRLLRAAVNNLVDASIRRSRRGGRVVMSYRQDNARASIVVSDDGEGMPYEELRDVLDLFSRAASPGLEGGGEVDASLLGLSVVRDIADLHGGRVAARNVEGGGSSFSLHLPHARSLAPR